MLTAASQCITDTQTFNEIGGNLKSVDAESVDLQISILFEEICETIDSFEARDAVELLDGAVDVFVVAVGLLQKLDKLGFNVSEALTRVAANNLEKFIPLGKPVQYQEGVISEYNDKYEVTVLKNLAGKLKKPANFKPVDLSDLIPTKSIWGESV